MTIPTCFHAEPYAPLITNSTIIAYLSTFHQHIARNPPFVPSEWPRSLSYYLWWVFGSVLPYYFGQLSVLISNFCAKIYLYGSYWGQTWWKRGRLRSWPCQVKCLSGCLRWQSHLLPRLCSSASWWADTWPSYPLSSYVWHRARNHLTNFCCQFHCDIRSNCSCLHRCRPLR